MEPRLSSVVDLVALELAIAGDAAPQEGPAAAAAPLELPEARGPRRVCVETLDQRAEVPEVRR